VIPTRTAVRGRQAEAVANDQRLLDAARDVFATGGYDAPVAAVAEAAGIGVGSLYRRYATREELLADVCLRSMRQMSAIARESRGIEEFVRGCVAARCGAFAGVAGLIPVSADMIAAARESQRLAARLVAAAHRDGELRRDVGVVDVLRLVELFARAPYPRDDPQLARLLAVTLDGLLAPAGGLPGRPATLASYRDRWSAP
jgi:AcrR family transcriptional regulator